MMDTARKTSVDTEGSATVNGKKNGETNGKSGGTVKLKRPAPKHNKPGNWRDGSVVDGDDKPSKSKAKQSFPQESPPSTSTTNTATTSPGPAPLVNQLDDTARENFATGRPLDDPPDLQTCRHCKKAFVKSAVKAHVEKCVREKEEKARKRKEAKERKKAEEAEGGPKPKKVKLAVTKKGAPVGGDEDAEGEVDGSNDSDADAPGEATSVSPEITRRPLPAPASTTKVPVPKTKATGSKNTTLANSKKRKADDDAPTKAPKKKKKDEPKPKAPKAKVPVDVERQCGVITPNGVPCARSLTCKSHSMGAKRAVPGRSLPYSMLLAAYQKKNQAKIQKMALENAAPLEDADDAPQGPVDSDEETALVMNALSKWRPQPVWPELELGAGPGGGVGIKRSYQLARLREQLDNACAGGNIFAVQSKNGKPLPGAANGIKENGVPGPPAGLSMGDGEEDAEGERDDAFMSGVGLSQPIPASTTPIVPPGVRRQSSVASVGTGVPMLQQQRSSFSVGAGR